VIVVTPFRYKLCSARACAAANNATAKIKPLIISPSNALTRVFECAKYFGIQQISGHYQRGLKQDLGSVLPTIKIGPRENILFINVHRTDRAEDQLERQNNSDPHSIESGNGLGRWHFTEQQGPGWLS
jgi:hypothetical protein